MKIKSLLILSVAVSLQAGPLFASSFPGPNSRDSLVTADSLDRLSVGADYTVIKRDITGSNVKETLEGTAIDGYFGVDITPWLTPFATLGGSMAKSSIGGKDGNYKFKWSGGLDLNIWHYDIVSPDFLAGRLSIQSLAEYSKYSSDNVGGSGNSVEWSDTTVVLPICYEMFEDISPIVDKSLQEGLKLYAGPALSVVDGKFTPGTMSFKEKQSFGFIAGADIFLASQLSIGAHVLVFDQPTITGSIRYHF